ncbi:MAG: hypothetical protein JKY80_03730 [Mariprofundaceae bacterium]|nr:hypothetical protein [Mariprofundaceae bacterium]
MGWSLSCVFWYCYWGDNSLFVADFYNNRIQQFNQGGYFIKKWGGKGVEQGELSGPTGVAVDRDGNVYIADWGNHRIQRFVIHSDS